MGFIALKPCNLQGRSYHIDDVIPAEAVLPSAEPGLLRRGYIASIPDTPSSPTRQKPAAYTLRFAKGGEVVTMDIGEEDLQQAIDVLLMDADTAQKAIPVIKSEPVLKAILFLESRKTVMTAIQKRASETENPPGKEGAS